MTREEVMKIINSDPHLTTRQGAAIIERMSDCKNHLIEEFNSLKKKYGNDYNRVARDMSIVYFMHGYVYASLELTGKIQV